MDVSGFSTSACFSHRDYRLNGLIMQATRFSAWRQRKKKRRPDGRRVFLLVAVSGISDQFAATSPPEVLSKVGQLMPGVNTRLRS